MKYKIVIAARAKKQIDLLPEKIKGKIANAILRLVEDPYIGKALKGPLVGLYSNRVGNYRIIYTIKTKRIIIEILKAMHRKDIYR